MEIQTGGEINMAKTIWKPLEKNHTIFTKGFSIYTPRTLRNVQGQTKKIPKWLLGRETFAALHGVRGGELAFSQFGNRIQNIISQNKKRAI